MKHIFLITIIAMLIIGCVKDNTSEDSYVVDVGLEFHIKNTNGLDLLNSSTANYFIFDSIKQFNDINGEIIEVYNPNLDLPRGLLLNTDTNPYSLRVFTTTDGFEIIGDEVRTGQTITYLKLNNSDTDTILTEWSKTNKSTTISKAWYNGDLIENHQLLFDIEKP